MTISFRMFIVSLVLVTALSCAFAVGVMYGVVIFTLTTPAHAEPPEPAPVASSALVKVHFQSGSGQNGCAFDFEGENSKVPDMNDMAKDLSDACTRISAPTAITVTADININASVTITVTAPEPEPTPEPEILLRTVDSEASDSLLFIRAEKGTGVLEVYRSEPYENVLKAHAWYTFRIEAIESAWIEDGKIFVSVVVVDADVTSLVYLEEPAGGW